MNENPDLAELLRYNREGCSHDRIPGALSVADAEIVRDQLGLRVFAEKFRPEFCPGCRDYVTVPR